MNTEKIFAYFMEGVTMIITLYEICRTGKINRRKK